MRLGVVDLSTEAWTAGGLITETVVRSLMLVSKGKHEIFVVGNSPKRWEGIAEYVTLEWPGVPTMSKLFLRLSNLGRAPNIVDYWCRRLRLSALFLTQDCSPKKAPYGRIAWIPDFQHLYLPQYFSDQEVLQRNATFLRWAECADRVLLSSRPAYDDFVRTYPQYSDRAIIAEFPSLFAFREGGGVFVDSSSRFKLPHRFLLVANQFWRHKNHAVVIDALALLASRGLVIHAVFTGLPLDYRDPLNKVISEVLQKIAERQMSGQIFPLGLVPRGDLVCLMRKSCVVVQPSRFEGWSTTVQDALALGRPVICSDIDVHREQAPDALGFFDVDNAETLATILAKWWPRLLPGPDSAAEDAGIAKAREHARRYGRLLLESCDVE